MQNSSSVSWAPCPDKTLQYHDLGAFVGLPKQQLRKTIGLELEKFPVLLPEFKITSLDGPGSLADLLERLTLFGWMPYRENGRITSLKRGNQKLSIEPGGQLELSTEPRERVEELRDQELCHLAEVAPWCAEHHIGWCGVGLHPLLPPESLPDWTKPRYDAMRRHFTALPGSMGHWMMKTTASIQIAMDFDTTRDLAIKVNVAARLLPIWTALFANSPILHGKESGFASYRSFVWQNTDSARCGLPDCFFDWNFAPDDYVEYALDVPILFVSREGRCEIPSKPLTFRRFLREGWSGTSANQEDWETHLSTLFPDIRLRHYLEFRCFDRQPDSLTYSAPSLLKALLYSPKRLMDWASRLQNISSEDGRKGMIEAAMKGMRGYFAGRPILAWAEELIDSALNTSQTADDLTGFEIDRIQELARRVVRQGASPAEELLNHFRSAATPNEWLRGTLINSARL